MARIITRAVAGLTAACALAACAGPAGLPGPLAAPGTPERAAQDAARYRLLTGETLCPTGPTAAIGAGAYDGGQPFSFSVVDDAGGDRGYFAITIAGVEWRGTSPMVVVEAGPTPRIAITGEVVHPTSGATLPIAFAFGGGTAARLDLGDLTRTIDRFADRILAEEKASCLRFNGGGTATATSPLGGSRSVTFAFDVTENGAADFGTVSLTAQEGSTLTGTSPTVFFDGGDLVIQDTVVLAGQITTIAQFALRIDLADPSTATTPSNQGPITFPLSGFAILTGLCDVGIP